jgi:DNA modification methylase
MRLQTLSSVTTPVPPLAVAVKRTDPVYNAHGYLTKVPVTAIVPFVETFSEPGDVVLDLFAGSGMTGVAASICGRDAELRDISVLAHHIGRNYVAPVDPGRFHDAARETVARARARVGEVYTVVCSTCGGRAELIRTTWSKTFACRGCDDPINYHRTLEKPDRKKRNMACDSCGESFEARRARRIGEEPVFDTIDCSCSQTYSDQAASDPVEQPNLAGLEWPDVPIGEERQMFQANALGKYGLASTARFFSQRNLAALAALRDEINDIADEGIQSKLLFAFTAILARASKRYQWSRARPLNAANQNYYIAPVFLEWNVYDLFLRKTLAVSRSDEFIRQDRARRDVENARRVNYRICSADSLDLSDESIDYVFTDPPFGSNIFYSDMSLFQEAWLGRFTDHAREAVVDRSGDPGSRRSAERYESLITDSLRECHRVLKPGRWLSLVFSNSSGEMWALVQRAIHAAGFQLEHVSLLDKGQRSVKGLASGFENTVTYDLILSMRKAPTASGTGVMAPPSDFFERTIEDVLREGADSPSHVYLGVVRAYLKRRLDLTEVDMAHVAEALAQRGYRVDAPSGLFVGVGRHGDVSMPDALFSA